MILELDDGTIAHFVTKNFEPTSEEKADLCLLFSPDGSLTVGVRNTPDQQVLAGNAQDGQSK